MSKNRPISPRNRRCSQAMQVPMERYTLYLDFSKRWAPGRRIPGGWEAFFKNGENVVTALFECGNCSPAKSVDVVTGSLNGHVDGQNRSQLKENIFLLGSCKFPFSAQSDSVVSSLQNFWLRIFFLHNFSFHFWNFPPKFSRFRYDRLKKMFRSARSWLTDRGWLFYLVLRAGLQTVLESAQLNLFDWSDLNFFFVYRIKLCSKTWINCSSTTRWVLTRSEYWHTAVAVPDPCIVLHKIWIPMGPDWYPRLEF